MILIDESPTFCVIVLRKALLKQYMSTIAKLPPKTFPPLAVASLLAFLSHVISYDVPYMGGELLVFSFICRLLIICFVWSEQ